MKQRIHDIRKKVRIKNPLIHCITNPISINQCANIVLAVQGKPIMAEHPKEVREITETSEALLLNLGNITDVRMESMLISVKEARDRGIPVVLDVVGVACSTLRRNFVWEISVEKGNGMFMVRLLDYISTLETVDIEKYLDLEETSKLVLKDSVYE